MTNELQPPVHQPGNIGQARNAARSMFDPAIARPALVDSFRKLAPRHQLRNPVMFCVYIGSILTTILWIAALGGQAEAPAGFILAIALWLWFTVLFANFAEALAEGRSKAQAASLRSAKKDVMAKKLNEPHPKSPIRILTASDLRKGDVVLV
ncbi:MAG: potassium-transporting ATPase subunit B, partial [Rudaea sp.]|nr:potassium-transporting ATPase subunit B [Rudaea sp.]